MKIDQILEARYHKSLDLENPEGWVFTVFRTHNYDDFIADAYASEDLGNSVFHMSQNPHVERTTVQEGIRFLYDYGLEMIYQEEHEIHREDFEDIEAKFDRVFEANSSIFRDGIEKDDYQFFMVPEPNETLTLLALK